MEGKLSSHVISRIPLGRRIYGIPEQEAGAA